MLTPSESLATPFRSVLVANRGEIACRIIDTLRRLGIRSIAVYSDADREARHVQLADLAVRIGPAAASESYLNVAAVMSAVHQTGADAVHPGYGFLSESTALAEACAAAGVVFVGPGEAALAVMGDKIRSKRHVAEHGVPVTPGSEQNGSVLALSDEQLQLAAHAIGYPVLVKPSAGGGGKGMQAVFAEAELPAALGAARRIALAAFGDETLFIEKLIERPRHIEVQLLADRAGNTLHLGERECSLQRRHQKVIEEAPSPLLSAETRARIGEAACAVARSVAYEGAGTVEFLVSDARPDEFFFMEMNTRLQVEHPVTEMVTGIDIVEWQLRIAAGQALPWAQGDITLRGHAVEARIYAEDAEQDFLPTTGRVLSLSEATGPGVRVDSSLCAGLEISSHYDPMLAKVIAWAPDRLTALERLDAALAETVILGAQTNIPFLRALVTEPAVRSGALDTGLIARFLNEGGAASAASPEASGVSSQHIAAAAALLATLHEPPANTGSASPLWLNSIGWRGGGADAARPRITQLLCTRAGVEHLFETSVHLPHAATESATVQVRQRASDASAGTPAQVPTQAQVPATESVHVVHVLGLRRQSGPGEVTAETGQSQLAIDGVAELWHWASDGAHFWVAARGETLRFEVLSREKQLNDELRAIAAARNAADGGAPVSPELRTPMPGTVVQLHVASGDFIERGQAVLTVEAMKMERAVTAPISGVARVLVAVGEAVQREQLVATIEPSTIEPSTIEPSTIESSTDTSERIEQ